MENKTYKVTVTASTKELTAREKIALKKAELSPKNEPKIEEKEVKIDQKVEEKPVVEAPQPQKIDDETLQKVEQYKKLLAEMEE